MHDGTRISEKTLAIALESLSGVYDELIIVDGGSNDSTCDIALSYGAKLIRFSLDWRLLSAENVDI